MKDTVGRPHDTGASDVDGEHEVQVRLLTAYVDAVAADRPSAELSELLDQLLDYSRMHFMSEQLLMRLYSYPGHDGHVLEHERAVARIEDLRAQHAAGQPAMSRDKADEVRQWILRHINEADRAFGHFLLEMRAQRI